MRATLSQMLPAALLLWKAGMDAKVDFLATDQYEGLALVRPRRLRVKERPSSGEKPEGAAILRRCSPPPAALTPKFRLTSLPIVRVATC